MPATAVSVHNMDGQLSCSICQRKFGDMTLSSCFHTFCPKCLQGNVRHSQRGQYECPICDAPISIPHGSVGDPQFDIGGASTKDTAYSTRLGEATCDICNDGKEASHHCLQCKERFCTSCTHAHLNMKASRYHGDQVLPLRDEMDDDQENYCPRHIGQKVLFFCSKCEVLVCNICKLLEHQDHVTKLVSEEANEVRERLSSLLRDQSYYLDSLQGRLRRFNDKKYQYPHELGQEIEKVRKQASKMHLEIEREKTESERELEQHYNSYISKVNESAEHLREDFDERASLITEAQQLLDSSNDLRFVRNGSNLCQKLEETSTNRRTESFVKTPDRPFKRFIPGVTNDPQSQRLVGIVAGNKSPTMHHGSPMSHHSASKPPDQYDSYSERSDSFGPVSPSPSEPIHLTHISDFSLPRTDLNCYVYGVAPIAGQQLAWVSILDHNRIILVDKDGNVENKVDLGEPCEGVASDSDGGCYVTCPRSRSILHVNSSGDIKPIAMDLTMDPHGVAGWQYLDTKRRTMIEELYVCFTDPRKRSFYEKPKGCVGIFSFVGEDLGKTVSVPSPVRIDVDLTTRMLCISDHVNGCVAVCDKSGKYTTALYTGDDTDEPFKPLGVCFDHTGHVIIADWAGGKVSRISQDGTLVQHLLTDIDGPQSVAMGDNGLLWIGGKKGRVSVYSVN